MTGCDHDTIGYTVLNARHLAHSRRNPRPKTPEGSRSSIASSQPNAPACISQSVVEQAHASRRIILAGAVLAGVQVAPAAGSATA